MNKSTLGLNYFNVFFNKKNSIIATSYFEIFYPRKFGKGFRLQRSFIDNHPMQTHVFNNFVTNQGIIGKNYYLDDDTKNFNYLKNLDGNLNSFNLSFNYVLSNNLI